MLLGEQVKTSTIERPRSFRLLRPPQDDDELAALVETLWGVRFPREPVCDGHVAPFTAFADAYFARSPVIVIHASRGFGGKSFLLSALSATEAAVLSADVSLLGGSGAQSRNILQHMAELWDSPLAPRHLLLTDPTNYQTRLRSVTEGAKGGRVKALMASTTSVRGPHPQRMRLDEADEVKLDILDPALGQAMRGRGLLPQTLISSTWQYPDKTMAELLRRAKDKDWPVYSWCYRENMAVNGGYLLPQDIATKRVEVTEQMWRVEYELQEPSFADLAIDREAIEAMFFGEELTQERHHDAGHPKGTVYATGADWARKQDWTVIATLDTRAEPMELVAIERFKRKPWPEQIRVFDDRVNRYQGVAAHDASGLGDVVAQHLSVEAEDVVLTPKTRSEVFQELIRAIEAGELRAPRVSWLYDELRWLTTAATEGREHPPDGFVALALAWRAAKQDFITAPPQGETRQSPWKM